MPLVPQAIASQILTQFSGQGLTGVYATNLASAIADAFVGITNTYVIQTVDIGVVGAGIGNGAWVLNPATGIPILIGALQGQALQGVSAPKIAKALGFALTAAAGQAIVSTTVVGVSNGSGTGSISNPNPPLATSLLIAAFLGRSITGTKAPTLAQALGQGLTQWFQTGIITTIVTGTPTPPFSVASGTGIGRIS
jgi:hypothetical protein